MTTEKIRILFVEDQEVDMELAVRELTKGGINVSFIRVDNLEDLLTQLVTYKPEIVISDYMLPGINGFDVLKSIKDHLPELPVIIFTGSMNEETAVFCMKSGATDYVLKDNLKRLPFAIHEALAQKQISEARKTAEKAFLESEEKYRLFMDSSGDIAFLKDDEFRYIMVNKANQLFFHLPENEIVGKTDFELMPEDAAKKCRSTDVEALKYGGLIVRREIFGDQVYESRKFPVRLKNEKTGIGGFVREITQQVEAEKLLHLQGTALNSAANAILITNTDEIILSANPAFSRLTGLTTDEVIGKKIWEITDSGIHPEQFYTEMRSILSRGEVWQGDMISKKKDGTYFNEGITITPVRDTEGIIRQYVSIRQDITERKNSELILEASESKYRVLVENALIGIYSSSVDGMFLNVNDSFCRILECDKPEILLHLKAETIYKNPEDRKKLIDALMRQGKVMNYEIELITLKGNVRSVLVNSILEGNSIIGMVMDITERKLNEKELLKAKEKAEESDILKTAFLTNISHEVRTPMNAISGYSDLLISPDYTDEEKHEYLKIVRESSKRLLKTMEDIVEISKISSGQLTDNPVPFIINTLLKDIVSEYSIPAKNKGLMLNLTTGLPDNASAITFDEGKLKQVISNLIDNAVKFTESGTINISYELKDSILEFRIKDTGIGLRPEHAEVVFERFHQLENSYTRKYRGSGLGLPIAKAFVEFLGGKIWMHSRPGEGSTFCFSIPYIPSTTYLNGKTSSTLQEDNFSKYTILVAEDDEINFVYMERLLSKTSAQIIRAANGQEAVDICTSGNHVDLILMDINMPFMNGLEATKIIKSDSPELPVIAVTAYSISGDKETCMAAGCDDYIPKPIRREELLVKLNQFLHK